MHTHLGGFVELCAVLCSVMCVLHFMLTYTEPSARIGEELSVPGLFFFTSWRWEVSAPIAMKAIGSTRPQCPALGCAFATLTGPLRAPVGT